LITGTLAIITIVFSVVLALRHDDWSDHWLRALLGLPFFVLLSMGQRHILIRRHGVALGLMEIPLVIGFYFAPAVLVVAVTATAMLIKELRLRAGPDKLAFNVARAGAGVATGGIVLEILPKVEGTGPGTWLVLGVATTANTIVTLLAMVALMATLQGMQASLEMLRVAWPGLLAAGVCIVIGLVFVVALDATWWSAFLLLEGEGG
jgi:hypothetical protein